ncbi:unnamed protein product [Didymodactylos carnosus]|uniref:Uncharacterized protein n=1 Tax=Didymodactylos carnosus TaxID=1234261 RepID=A0A816AQI6_9BILA|nr:unnamed protein product [Didymodactylos carnosus]CAF1598886.1 unnamed protein product [Didymodactylos carnosus]CAF4352603.1 unnamed protein product [Didymodactylos carnosus]CAF4475084.1 unnamed protein product [Didymodactylos carnosus]
MRKVINVLKQPINHNELSFTLNIKLSKNPEKIGNLINEKAPPGAKIMDITVNRISIEINEENIDMTKVKNIDLFIEEYKNELTNDEIEYNWIIFNEDELNSLVVHVWNKPIITFLSPLSNNHSSERDIIVAAVRKRSNNLTSVNYPPYNLYNSLQKKTYTFENEYATVKQFTDAIIDFEKLTRPNTNWFGGVDIHHIFYEGIRGDGKNGYEIMWGS